MDQQRFNKNKKYLFFGKKKIAGVGGGALCFRKRGAEDNFIFYIEYYLFFAPVKKLRRDYNILKQF